ncbi:MAG: hypothetical protein BHW07_01625 [Clostridium sp. CAG_433_25_7]|nr:MAG: hypothetical protein BHW07_01625 [Clostridium sp. CAG_433_25_7]
MKFNPKINYIIISISITLLYFALISPKLLPNVTIPIKDALIISFFVIFTYLCVKIINFIYTKKLENKIILQHAQMKTIIDNVSVSFYLKDLEGNIILTNESHSKLTDLKIDDIIGEKSDSFYHNLEHIKEEDETLIANKQILKKERYLELKNGKNGWYQIVKVPVLNDENEVQNIVVLLYNIDEEKNLEERKETFVATLTHDLKTPTIAQIKAIDLLLNQTFGSLNQNQIEFLEQIKNSCKYMYDLIFTILDTYLYDSGQIKIQFEEFDLRKLIDESINEISNLLIEKEQNIKIKSTLNNNNICGDKFQLKRVIINLLSNAIIYGNKESNIELILNEDENNIILNVKNKSGYIPDDKILDLYEKFKRKDNIKFHKSGSGLGLYLSKQIIMGHNGDIFAKSDKEEQSCTFGFSLPKKFNFLSQTTQAKM